MQINTIKTGEQIEKLLKENKMSKGKFAEALEVSRSSVSHWCDGEMLPRIDRLMIIGKMFNVRIEDIVVCED